MALIDNIVKKAGLPVLVGVGVALVAPIILPAAAALMRPLAKSVIKGYLSLADKVKEAVAESGEQLSDLVAEARAERESELAAAAAVVSEAVEAPAAEAQPAQG